jgi:hypothetical protein
MKVKSTIGEKLSSPCGKEIWERMTKQNGRKFIYHLHIALKFELDDKVIIN